MQTHQLNVFLQTAILLAIKILIFRPARKQIISCDTCRKNGITFLHMPLEDGRS